METKDTLHNEWQLHASACYTISGNEQGPPNQRRQDGTGTHIIGLFVSRIVLPVVVTFYLGYRLEHVLNRDQTSHDGFKVSLEVQDV